MVYARFQHVDLPFSDQGRWSELKNLYAKLQGVKDTEDLVEILQRIFEVSGNDIKQLRVPNDRSGAKETSDSLKLSWHFQGLLLFFDKIATEQESATFFETILPFIVSLASSIEEFAPSEGILLCSQQRESGIVLDRRFIACLLASAFLCAFPSPADDIQVRSINFVHLFTCFHREDIQDAQAAKLRCLIHYFERLSSVWPDVTGRVFYSRQVIPSNSLPSLDDWMSCDLPLCPVIVDNKTSIENSGEHMLQVDFANRFIGGGVLGAGHVQEEIRFCINPELLVALMTMEAMQDNEGIVIRGAERFSSYSGYGRTFNFTGDFKDDSERDKDGDFQTTVVAIDAKRFKDMPRETQFEESALIRELNKALVGFYNPEVGTQILRTQSDEESDASLAESEDFVSSEELVVSSEDLAASSEETETLKKNPSSEDVKVMEIQEFSSNLVNVALSQAMNEVNNDYFLEDFVDGDIVTNVMKKSLSEVFGSTPEKVRRYSENLLSPSLLPKCLSLSVSGSNSPTVPGTPPSSPAMYDPNISEQKSLESQLGLNTSLSLNRSSSKDSSLSFSVKSFADSLSNSLMSCVELTSTLATAIATVATSPGQVVSDTKEAFCKSPKKIRSPVKNGDSILSFLNQKVTPSEISPNNTYSNGFHFTAFVEDLSSLVKSSKLERVRVADDSDSCLMSLSARQNLMEEFNQVGDESNAKVCEQFATKLSSLIVDIAITSLFGSQFGRNELEKDALEIPTEHITDPDSTDSSNGQIDTGSQSLSDAVHIKDSQKFLNVLNGRVDALLADTIHSALAEAVEYCVEKTACDWFSSPVDDEHEPLKDKDGQGETENGTVCVSRSDVSDVNSSESSEKEQSDFPEGDKLTVGNSLNALASEIPEAVYEIAEKLSQNISYDGVVQALAVMKEKSKELTTEVQVETPQEVTELEPEKKTEESLSSFDKEGTDKQTLNGFVEDLSSMTIHGAVKIAGALLEKSDGEPRLRPVATGNWGCGVFKGDPELKAVIQWAAASAAGCPVVVYHTFGDQRMSQFLKALVCLHSRGWKVSDVIQGVLRFYKAIMEGGKETAGKYLSLLSFLCQMRRPSIKK